MTDSELIRAYESVIQTKSGYIWKDVLDLINRRETELAVTKRKNEKLLKMIEEEREKVKGYEEIAKVYSAYISILLKRLGATELNMINITASEIKEAMDKYEARAIQTGDGYGLYHEIINEK